MSFSPLRSRSPFLCLGLVAVAGLACRLPAVSEQTQWYSTCGDPVCRGYQRRPDVTRCTSERPGDACTVDGQTCDPVDSCNRLLVCAARDPKLAGCPISHRDAKRDIRYLTAGDLEGYARELRAIRLAAYRYRDADPSAPPRLGFVIEDGPPAACVDAQRDRVDLYGYTSLAVAALQAQAREIEQLRRDVAALREKVEKQRRD